jgi:preprotein translocase subunit SecA
MTGTAQGAAAEFDDTYGLRVAVIPTNFPVRRIDHADVVFAGRDAKEQAVVAEVMRAHALGRPVLVGTLSVEESERLAARLMAAGTPCHVLNARNDDEEAGIIAEAGRTGAVTISTNMAGRGTDIRLGGGNESEREHVVAAGGLYVIGTNRHESRRVDLQLRGRAGRQGDPGESRFFVSLDDDLMVRYRLGDLLAGRVRADRPGPIENPIVRSEIARVQRIVEGQHFEIRRTLRRYAEVLDRQRQQVMARREAVLSVADDWRAWPTEGASYQAAVVAAGEPAVRRAEQLVTLGAIDRAWRDHLSFSADLREGVHLVTLGGMDPLTHYTREMIAAFTRLMDRIDRDVLDAWRQLTVEGTRLDFGGHRVKGPSSTWTYLVNDDPFRHHIARLLTGPGNATIAVYASAMLTPLMVLWGIIERLRARRPHSRSDARNG